MYTYTVTKEVKMRRIGIIGGMSYESTLHYYERINRQVNECVGGLASADLVLQSVNFEDYHKLVEKGDWVTIGRRLRAAARNLFLENQCNYVAIATNTMHKVAEYIAEPYTWIQHTGARAIRVEIPLVHIGDCIAEKCKEVGAKRVLLLGTKFTMTEDFMAKRLAQHGINVMSVDNYPEEIEEIDRIIFDELCHGVVTAESKEFMMNFVYQFPADSDIRPDAIVLGCTELEMILEQDDVDIPLINSTQAHIDKIVELCLED